jgi:hypothetical protein
MALDYTVKEGDTLNGIATANGFSNYQDAGITSVPSGNFDLIKPGDQITLGNAKDSSTIPNNPAAIAATSTATTVPPNNAPLSSASLSQTTQAAQAQNNAQGAATTKTIVSPGGNTYQINDQNEIVSGPSNGDLIVGSTYSPSGTVTSNSNAPANTNEQYVLDNVPGTSLADLRSKFTNSLDLSNYVSTLKSGQGNISAEDASWQAIQDQINQQRQAGLQSIQAKVGAVNSAAAGTEGADAGAEALNTRYDQLLNTAQAQHEQAIAQLTAGNVKSASDLLQQMQQNIDTAKQLDISNAAQLQTQQNQNAQLDLTTQTKFQTQADKEAQGINTAQAATLETLSNTPLTPGTDGTYTPAQQSVISQLNGIPGYQSLINSGYTPQDALNYLNGVAQGNKETAVQQKVQLATQQVALSTAKIQNQLAEFDLTHAQTQANIAGINAFQDPSIPNGGAYANALSAIQANGIKDTPNSEGMTTAGIIGTALASGDTKTANNSLINMALQAAKKNDPSAVKIYTGINTINQYMNTVANLINQLPTGLQPGLKNGTVQNILAWAGQNKTGPNSTVAAEINDAINHATIIYSTEIASSRPSAELMNSIKGTLPNYSDTNALNTASINAMSNLTSSINSSVIGGAIGADNYQTIFGGMIPTANTTTTGATVNWSDPSSGATYPVGTVLNLKNGTKVTITTTGPVAVPQNNDILSNIPSYTPPNI